MSFAVVGAGISGLTAAYELQKAGYNVVVYEKSNRIAGRMGTLRDKVLPFDVGAQLLSKSYVQAEQYMKELGIANQCHPIGKMKHQVYDNGNYPSLAKLSIQTLLSLNTPLLEKINAIYNIMALHHTTSHLDFFDQRSYETQYDQMDGYTYSVKTFGKEMTDKVINPIVSGYHIEGSEKVSAAVFRAGLASSFNRQMSQLAYTPGGIDLIAKKMEENLNVSLYQEVEKIDSKDGKVTILSNGSTKTFDAVVIATEADSALKILSTPTQEQKDLLEHVAYSTSMTVSFLVPAHLVLDVAIVAVPKSSSSLITGYLNTSARLPKDPNRQDTLISAWVRHDAAKQAMEKEDDAVFDEVKKEILKFCPWLTNHASQMKNDHVYRLPKAIPLYQPGTVQKVNDFWQNAQGKNGIFFAGDYLNSPWGEGSMRIGKRVAEQLIANVKGNQKENIA